MQESKRTKIVNMINEVLKEVDLIPGLAGRDAVPYEEIISAHPEEFADIEPGRQYDAARKADMRGQAKILAMIDKLPETEIDKVMKVAKDEYIDLFEEVLEGEADPEDIADLKKLSPLALYETSDSFKFFYKAAFVLPAIDDFQKSMSKIDRVLVKDLDGKLRKMKVPNSVISTAINQLLGATARDASDIMKKFNLAAKSGELKPEEVEMQYKSFMRNYPALEASAKKERADKRGDAAKAFIDASIDSYSKMTLNQRKDILIQAFARMG
jgi:hypothetical protein